MGVGKLAFEHDLGHDLRRAGVGDIDDRRPVRWREVSNKGEATLDPHLPAAWYLQARERPYFTLFGEIEMCVGHADPRTAALF
jgi:hypothetical protein